MLGFSIQKLLFTVAVCIAVWYGFKWVGRMQVKRDADAKAKLRRQAFADASDASGGPGGASGAADDAEANKALIATVAEAAVKALTESDTFKAIAEGQTELTATVKGLSDRLDALERTDDEKIAAQVGARNHRPNGRGASLMRTPLRGALVHE